MTPLTFLIPLAILSELINGFWIYVIYAKTSQKMAKFKQFLLRMAVADLATSISLSWIIQPDLLLPVPAFRVNGLMQYIDVSYALYVGGLITVCSVVGTFVSVLECCTARLIMCFGRTYFLKYMGGLYAIAYLSITYFVSIFLSCVFIQLCIMDLNETLQYSLKHNISLYLSVVNFERDLVYGIDLQGPLTFPLGYMSAVIITGFIFLVFVFSVVTQRKIISQLGKSVSRPNYKDQSNLTLLFVSQGSVPLLAMILPMFLVAVPWLFHVPSAFEIALVEYVGTTMFISYPLLNSVLSLVLIRPYKVYVKSLLNTLLKKTHVTQITSRVAETT